MANTWFSLKAREWTRLSYCAFSVFLSIGCCQESWKVTAVGCQNLTIEIDLCARVWCLCHVKRSFKNSILELLVTTDTCIVTKEFLFFSSSKLLRISMWINSKHNQNILVFSSFVIPKMLVLSIVFNICWIK